MKWIRKEYRKYWILGIWVLIIGYLVFSFGIVGSNRNSTLCSGYTIGFDHDPGKNFIHEDEIKSIIEKNDIKLEGVPLQDINTAYIESLVSRHSYAEEVAVYKTMFGEVRIDITQKQPLVRIINNKNQSFYLDQDGKPLPFSPYHTPHVLIAGGFIPMVDFSKVGEEVELPKVLTDIYQLAKFIADDDFWNAQIMEVFVSKEGEFQLVPRVGGHRIDFGGIDRCERKFAKLEALYKQAFEKQGWSKYRAINLKYKDQVVCTIKDRYR